MTGLDPGATGSPRQRRGSGEADADSGPGLELILPDRLKQRVDAGLAQAHAERVVERVWERDPRLWSGARSEPESRLGWLDVSYEMETHLDELVTFARQLSAEGYTDAVLLGVGGSSLGTEVIRRSFGDIAGAMRLRVLDSAHPDAILALEQSMPLDRTVFILSSESADSDEALALRAHFRARAKPEQFVVVASPDHALADPAGGDGVGRTFVSRAGIGPGYSVLSHHGLVPAALAGVPVDALIRRCRVAEEACSPRNSTELNLGLQIGVTIGELARSGHDKLTFVCSEPIGSLGLWAGQLLAGWGGSAGRIVPVVNEPLGPPSVYGPDRAFLYLRHGNRPSAEIDARVDALISEGHPTIRQVSYNAAGLGRLFYLFEFAAAVAGWVLGADPFNQADSLGATDEAGRTSPHGPTSGIKSVDDQALRELLAVRPPHHVAIIGHLPTAGPGSEGIDAAVSELRTAIRDATGMATTWSYGCRFPRSPGREHVAGPPYARILQLVDEPMARLTPAGGLDVFRTLIDQASTGELATVRAHGLAAERVVLRGHPAEAIRLLTQRICALMG